MSFPTIPQIITIAKISQYSALVSKTNGKVYKGGNFNMVRLLYMVRKNVEWEYGQEGIIPEINPTATVTITDIGNDGDRIQIVVDDPLLGIIALASYQKLSTDTTLTILAASIVTVIMLNFTTYGYSATSLGALITITGRIGLGALINGGNFLSIIVTPTPFILINATDFLLINSSDKLLI